MVHPGANISALGFVLQMELLLSFYKLRKIANDSPWKLFYLIAFSLRVTFFELYYITESTHNLYDF